MSQKILPLLRFSLERSLSTESPSRKGSWCLGLRAGEGGRPCAPLRALRGSFGGGCAIEGFAGVFFGGGATGVADGIGAPPTLDVTPGTSLGAARGAGGAIGSLGIMIAASAGRAGAEDAASTLDCPR
jgi:hypothetical protein